MTLICADCLDAMPAMEPDSVDAIVTDPPYGLGFMGKSWDAHGMKARTATQVNSILPAGGQAAVTWEPTGYQSWCVEWATAALRVAKPGAYLLAFGGTRTYHRLACAIEDAGWEVRDCLVWAYSQGFPKSLNLPGGLGTALKPAWEPIILARKPLAGTVAANVLRYGTGALNIDGCRIPHNGRRDPAGADGRIHRTTGSVYGAATTGETFDTSSGRWPANVILTADDAGRAIFDGDMPGVVGGGETSSGLMRAGTGEGVGLFGLNGEPMERDTYGDSGTYSRFFLIAKADRADREPVLGGLPVAIVQTQGRVEGRTVNGDGSITVHGDTRKARANVHPTVKPTELMRHLVRLVTPPGGLVLDPFAGSGSTLLAAEMEGFRWVGIEREAEYVAIAEARLPGTQRGMGLVG